ncbi:MAG: hypothetical protein Q9163_005456 [Psora crenata]
MAAERVFKGVKDGILTALVDTTRTASQILNEDITFHRSLNPSVGPLLEQQSSRLLHLATSLTNVASSGTDVPAPKYSDAESVDDSWRSIVDVVDNLLEKADACLDEYTGVIKRLSPSLEEQAREVAPRPLKQKRGKAYQSLDIAKPQLQFSHAPQNLEKTPFKPLLTSKPHAVIPLSESLQLVPSAGGSQQYDTQSSSSEKDAHRLIRVATNAPRRYKHPYETEIKEAQPPPSVYLKSEPISPLPYNSNVATFVDTPEAVQAMLEELKQSNEIAIDLEHHDEHSYVGLVSLMQVSTREKDWVVDTLRPWRQDLQVLNEVFANPKILKVFHGSFMDMIWLQRDLGLYVVGLFDTYHATIALRYPKRSLAFLLKKFVDFNAAKQYQMADWRIRPLPEELFNYARSDTHFLLYIYDMMRNELIEKSDLSQPDGDLIGYVIEHSKKESLQKYECPVYDDKQGSGSFGWYNMLHRTPTLFNREQFAVFRAVHQWRDQVAREEDESPNSIMPRRVLYSIARETPTDMASLLGCSHPISKPYQMRKNDLLRIVRQAKATGATGPEMRDVLFGRDPTSLHPPSAGESINEKTLKYGGEVFSTSAGPGPNEPLPVISHTSAFWGASMETAQKASDQKLQGPVGRFPLVIPLPVFTAEVFMATEAPNGDIRSRNDPSVDAEHQYVQERKPKEEDIFTVRDYGRAKKRKAADAELDPKVGTNGTLGNGIDDAEGRIIALDGEDAEAEKLRVERKREKNKQKQERKRLRQEKASQVGNVAGRPEAEPFDYRNAPSVLHVRNGQGVKTSGTKGADPYAKSLNAPKGMRKSQKEVAGKSFTFKK